MSPQIRSRRQAQALVGLIVVMAIIIAAAGIYLGTKGKNPDGSTSSHTVLRRDLDLAQEVVLQSNLQQIQMGIGMYKQDNEGKVPASLEELKSALHYPAEMWINPVDKKPLGYDPTTGLILVTPYEGESPSITKMTADPMHGADQPTSAAQNTPPSTPSEPTADTAMPNLPSIPDTATNANTDGDTE